MKAQIKFLSILSIPKQLPHEEGDESNDIFGDSVGPRQHETLGQVLQLASNHGTTCFWEWTDKGDHYEIPAGSRVFYDGARNALNAVWGITFPACEVTHIESTVGKYRDLSDYDNVRRLVLPLIRNLEGCFETIRNPRYAGNTEATEQQSTEAKEWVGRVTASLSTLMDLDNCGNRIP